MASYKYEVLSRSGVKVRGVIQAQSSNEAIIKLKNVHSAVLSLKEVGESRSFMDILTKPSRVDEKALAIVCNQFAIILEAGLPLVRTVQLVALQTEDKTLKSLLDKVADDVNSGYKLADSFSQYSRLLPISFIETVRAGEESGSLEITFRQLSNYFTKKSKVGGKVKAALAYPAFVIVVAIVVIAIIMAKAVPTFTKTFAELGTSLPLPTRALIVCSNFFSKYLWVMFFLVAFAVAVYNVYKHTPEGAMRIERFKLSMPVLGKIRMLSACGYYASTFSTMIIAGVPMVRALNITAKTIGNKYLEQSLMRCCEKMEQGFKLGDSLKAEGIFPELLTEMTAIGENSGSVEKTLLVVSDFYDTETENMTAKAVALLEPAIICVLAVFVVWVLMAVYLPMFSMYGGIG